jgi:hypothetical protein
MVMSKVWNNRFQSAWSDNDGLVLSDASLAAFSFNSCLNIFLYTSYSCPGSSFFNTTKVPGVTLLDLLQTV